ncbi:hypothetical protein ACFFX0_26090 [Citricoccus parietis]|uniref:Uncharacterized protein n=1 Tax=Citricoccus parietis TaxID=592307 RepID=A0ABV5G6B5_9MICC
MTSGTGKQPRPREQYEPDQPGRPGAPGRHRCAGIRGVRGADVVRLGRAGRTPCRPRGRGSAGVPGSAADGRPCPPGRRILQGRRHDGRLRGRRSRGHGRDLYRG